MVTLEDVRQAMEVTKDMTPYHRLRYFQDKGIHYSRSLRYIKMVEEFERMLHYTSPVIIEPVPIKWEEEPTIEMSSNDLGMWIGHHGLNAEETKFESKMTLTTNLQTFVKQVVNILVITIILLFVQYFIS
jgi:hypothetical protein